MEVTDIDKTIFSEVKASCIELSQIAFLPPEVAQTPLSSRKLTDALQNLYNQLSSSVSKHCQEQHTNRLVLNHKVADYIFVPISYLLKQSTTLTDKQVELTFKLINILITHCWYFPVNASSTLFTQLFPLSIYLIDEEKSHIHLSAESRIAGIDCLNSLLESIIIQESPFFKDAKSLSLLGQLITLTLKFVMIQNSIVLQSKCLDMLSKLYMEVLNDGEVLSHILPGNVSTLTKLIAQKEGISTHYTVLVKVTNLLSFLISKVFKDKDLQTINKKQEIHDIHQLVEFADERARKKDNSSSNNNIDNNSIIATQSISIIVPETSSKQHRTTSWLTATSSQIKLAIPIIVTLKDHKKFEVRKSLLEFCESVVRNCSISLDNCLPLIVDAMSFLSNDPILSNGISEWVSSEPVLGHVIRSKLEAKISLLPSSLSSSNQEKIVSDLNSLSFYLSNFENVNDFLIESFIGTVQNSMYRYINAEITTKRFKNKNIQVLAKADSVSNELMILQNNFNHKIEKSNDFKMFDKFYDAEVEKALSNILRNLGQNPKFFNSLTKFLLSNGDEPLSRAISLWMINNMIEGLGMERAGNRISNVVDEFLTLDQQETVEIDYEAETLDTIYGLLEDANELLLETATSEPDLIISMIQSVALDSIGLSSTVLKELFKDELIDYLYPVIDSLASFNDQIRAHAQQAALVISNICYHGSLHDLIFENRDYLIDSLSLKLTSDFITPRTSAVLLVLIKVGGMDLIRQMNDVVHTMFTLLDLYHGYDSLSEGFFVVFNNIIDQVYETYLKGYDFKKETTNVENYNSPWGMVSLKQVSDIIDSKKRELEINLEGKDIPLVKHPNVPFGELPDSDDEEDEEKEEDGDEMALMREIDNYQIQKVKEEEQKWDSPIPNDLYYIIQQMLSYGDRLVLSTDSIRLQTRILEVFGKVFPILSTSQMNLLPILADIWPLVLNLVTDDDVRVVANAIEIIRIILDFGGDFMSKKFGELWITLTRDSKLFDDFYKILNVKSDTTLLVKKLQRFESNVNFKAYRSINQCLVFGVKKLGTTISNKMVKEIIDRTILLFPDEESYGYYSDVAWLVKFERFNSLSAKNPGSVMLQNGVSFEFYDYNSKAHDEQN